MNEKEAIILLNLISGLGPIKVKALINAFQLPSKIFQQNQTNLSKVKGISAKLADKILAPENSEVLHNELNLVEKCGVTLITILDEEYPEILKEIYDAPLCLYIRGDVSVLKSNCIGIVGSRRISTYGQKMSSFLSESAGYAGWTVVSGLAYGADIIAHRGALNANGKTIAVLGGGLAKIHPQDHIPTAKEIVENGCVISEFPMQMSPTRQTFPMRNRIISGLSQGTIVIEASINSGSLITANFANEQNRTVFAVPCQADSSTGRGCNDLIKKGAKLTENFDDVLEEFEFVPNSQNFQKKVKNEIEEPGLNFNIELSKEEQIIIDAISLEPLSIEKLVEKTKISVGDLLSITMQMEIKKLIKQEDRRYTLKA